MLKVNEAANKIKYTKSNVAANPTFRTEKFGNLMSDTYLGEVSQDEDGSWLGCFMNLSVVGEGKYRFNFASRAAASHWVNKHLRKVIK